MQIALKIDVKMEASLRGTVGTINLRRQGFPTWGKEGVQHMYIL